MYLQNKRSTYFFTVFNKNFIDVNCSLKSYDNSLLKYTYFIK